MAESEGRVIGLIMWSLAMMITGATIATWFYTKKKFTSGSGVFTAPKETTHLYVMGADGSAIKISKADDIPKETYAVEERYE